MTSAPVEAERLTGRAPGGMWWVAWRQHRWAMLVSLGLLVALAVTLLVFGLSYRSALSAAAIDPVACPDPYQASSAVCAVGWEQVRGYQHGWRPLHLPMMLVPPMIGVIVGASLFAPERERGTQVFALTQSVGRTRWYLTKCVVVVIPLLLATLAVGLLADWVRGTPGLGFNPMDTPEFQSTGLIPAAFALVGFGVAVPAGVFLRSTAVTFAVAFALTAVLVAGVGYTIHRDLVPHDQVTTSLATDRDPLPADALVLGTSYLDVDGKVADVHGPACSGSGAGSFEERWQACLDSIGAVSRSTEYLDPSRRPQLTLTLSGICMAIAAAGFTLGWVRARRRVL